MLLLGIIMDDPFLLFARSEILRYTVSGKKGATLFLPVTLRNANRFSKFFYHHTLQ